jgi:hypothetical protein
MDIKDQGRFPEVALSHAADVIGVALSTSKRLISRQVHTISSEECLPPDATMSSTSR